MADEKIGPRIPRGCPMDHVIRLMSGRWTPHILWALANNGPTRFGALRRLMPERASAKAISERLQKMEANGLVRREAAPTTPPEVTYSLTGRGWDLDEILRSMHHVAARWDDQADTRH